MFSMRKVKASHNSALVQHLYESHFLLLKKPALSEVQRYSFESLLNHQLTRDNTFAWIRTCGNEEMWKSRKKILENSGNYAVATFRRPRKSFYGPKIIYITIAKSSFTVFDNMILTVVRADVIFFDRMVVEQWLEFDLKRDLKGFFRSFALVTNKM